MDLNTLPIGNSYPDEVNVVIEIPKGSHHKYEYKEELQAIILDRVLHSAVFYPADYGFIPQTKSADGDALDILVIITEPLFPGCVLSVRPIGLLDMEDGNSQDWKIISVAVGDPKLKEIQSVDDISPHYKMEIEAFFSEYKKLENKTVIVKKWLGKSEAHQLINQSHQKYLDEKRG